MLSRHNPVDIETALRASPPVPSFPRASDRAAWEDMKKAVPAEYASGIIAAAEKDAATDIPSLPATLWLEFQRNGQREGYQKPRTKRRTMLNNLVLAECLEHRGRFLDPIMNVIWAICEESAWVMPAHQRVLTDMEEPVIDLGSAMTSLELAETDALLGADLDPLVGKRIRYEVNRRSWIPYLARHDHWWLYNNQTRTVNNWTAVCNAGVVGSAIYLEPDMGRLAELIARAARSEDDYLSTFDSDGGSTEGPGYWNYGFGYFTVLAQLVEQRTGGRIRFMDEDVVRKAAQFPLRTALQSGTYVNFSDCDRTIHFTPALLAYLSRRLDLPDLMKVARNEPHHGARQEELVWGLRSLFWWPSAKPAGKFVNNKHDWFSQMMWMMARMDPADANALSLAAKGGHNGEMHNQNDVGNFIVHIDGESIIPDIGRGRYTKAYFGPERYEHLVNSSRGHSLPVVNGHEQLAGTEYAAQVIEHRADASIDLLSIEMKGVYPQEAGLASLKRTVALHREAPRGWIEVVDDVTFAGKAGQMDSVLTTFAQVELGEASVTIRGEKAAVKVTFDPKLVKPSLVVKQDVDLSLGPQDVNLVMFSFLKARRQGMISLRIEPA